MLFRKTNATDGMVPQPGARMKFFRTQIHTDTVVFVHGILGHYVTSWGEFPRLLSNDPDLPDLDVLLWGYRTGWWEKHNDLQTEGAQLITTLHALVRPG